MPARQRGGSERGGATPPGPRQHERGGPGVAGGNRTSRLPCRGCGSKEQTERRAGARAKAGDAEQMRRRARAEAKAKEQEHTGGGGFGTEHPNTLAAATSPVEAGEATEEQASASAVARMERPARRRACKAKRRDASRRAGGE